MTTTPPQQDGRACARPNVPERAETMRAVILRAQLAQAAHDQRPGVQLALATEADHDDRRPNR